jgi:hypothetical protein
MILFSLSFEEHLSTHHTNSLCKYCGKQFIAMNLLIQHQSECGKIPTHCQLEPYGCTEQVNKSLSSTYSLYQIEFFF